MSQNTEQIEAKLCAYIEDELDAAGRAEIEKHLEANPQHQRLIVELSQTRDLVKLLPREKAPPEIVEVLQGQLERSVLLDASEMDDADAHLRISRWPQFIAVAAVLMLAVGLGAVVYFVLPPTGMQGHEFSVVQPKLETVEAESDAGASDHDASNGLEAPLAVADGAPPALSVIEGTPGAGEDLSRLDTNLSLTGPVASNSPPAPMHSAVGGDRLFANPQLRSRNRGEAHASNTLFVVVETNNPSVANSQVHSYLASNRIHWEAVAEPMPQPIPQAEMRGTHMGRLQQSKVRMKVAPPAKQQQALRQSERQEQVAGVVEKSAVVADTADTGEKKDPTTQPAQAQAQPQVQDPFAAPDQEIDVTTSDQAPIENLIIARGMTKIQCDELRDSLAKNGGAQQAQVYHQSVDTEALQIRLNEVAAAQAPQQQATRPASVLQLYPDVLREIRLLHEPILPTIEQQMQQVFGVAPEPQPQDRPAAPPVLTAAEPAVEEGLREEAIVPFDASFTLTGGPPAPATTQPAPDERVDVVIVVQNRAIAAPPTTAPAPSH